MAVAKPKVRVYQTTNPNFKPKDQSTPYVIVPISEQQSRTAGGGITSEQADALRQAAAPGATAGDIIQASRSFGGTLEAQGALASVATPATQPVQQASTPLVQQQQPTKQPIGSLLPGAQTQRMINAASNPILANQYQAENKAQLYADVRSDLYQSRTLPAMFAMEQGRINRLPPEQQAQAVKEANARLEKSNQIFAAETQKGATAVGIAEFNKGLPKEETQTVTYKRGITTETREVNSAIANTQLSDLGYIQRLDYSFNGALGTMSKDTIAQLKAQEKAAGGTQSIQDWDKSIAQKLNINTKFGVTVGNTRYKVDVAPYSSFTTPGFIFATKPSDQLKIAAVTGATAAAFSPVVTQFGNLANLGNVGFFGGVGAAGTAAVGYTTREAIGVYKSKLSQNQVSMLQTRRADIDAAVGAGKKAALESTTARDIRNAKAGVGGVINQAAYYIRPESTQQFDVAARLELTKRGFKSGQELEEATALAKQRSRVNTFATGAEILTISAGSELAGETFVSSIKNKIGRKGVEIVKGGIRIAGEKTVYKAGSKTFNNYIGSVTKAIGQAGFMEGVNMEGILLRGGYDTYDPIKTPIAFIGGGLGGAVSAGYIGGSIVKQSIISPKKGKALLFGAYASDTGEYPGDVLASTVRQGMGYEPLKGIRIKVSTNTFTNVFTNTNTFTNTQTKSSKNRDTMFNAKFKMKAPKVSSTKTNIYSVVTTSSNIPDIVNIKFPVTTRSYTPANYERPKVKSNINPFTSSNVPVNININVPSTVTTPVNVPSNVMVNIPANINTNINTKVTTPITTNVPVNVNTPVTVTTVVPTIDLPGIFPFGGGGAGRKGRKGRAFRLTQYQPSVVGAAFKIKAKSINRRLTGLEVRGLL